jgi:CHAT domain-containing protein
MLSPGNATHRLPLLPLALIVVVLSATAAGQEGQLATLDRLERDVVDAEARLMEGDVGEARRLVGNAWSRVALLGEAVSDARAQDLLWRLGHAAYGSHDPRVAHDAWAAVVAHRERSLPEESLDLQKARVSLACARLELGDHRGALEVGEKACTGLARVVEEDDPALQTARLNLAAARHGLGDLEGALAIQQRVFEVRRRTLPDEHPDLQITRLNMAATKKLLGDLAGARRLEEKVYEVFVRTLADDHPDLQAVRWNLAITKQALGDLAGAHALFARVYDVLARLLPADHRDLQATRANLASIKRKLGDAAGARDLFQASLAALGALPDDHLDPLRMRLNLAVTKVDLGEGASAREDFEQIHAAMSRVLPDAHPDLQEARENLASIEQQHGRLESALDLRERVYAVFRRTLPDDHPSTQAARRSLAWTHAILGRTSSAARLAREQGEAARRRLTGWALSPRELGAMAAQEREGLDLLLALALGFGDVDAQSQLIGDALLVSQALRGAETHAAQRSRRARAVDAERTAALERELRTAVVEVDRLAGASAQDAEAAAARAVRLARAVEQKERVQRLLHELANERGGVRRTEIGVEDLVAALPAGAAAAAIVGFSRIRSDPDRAKHMIADDWLAAFVVDAVRGVRLLPIGATAGLLPALEALREAVRSGGARGLRPVGAAAGDTDAFERAMQRLREALIAPLMDACGPVRILYVAVDDTLELVPLDALPCEGGLALGERVELRPLVSLFDLLEPPGDRTSEPPRLLVAGGLDYAPGGLATEPSEPSTDAGSWTRLPGSGREASAVAALFLAAFPHGVVDGLDGNGADEARVAQAAMRADFVHLATHGYFAPESEKSTADTGGRVELAEAGSIAGLSPLLLCGLALSGANARPDELGGHAGILTAEEILALDLSHCHLATLSACDTSLGIRRAGQGYASLRAALQGAGVRYVLTSLWKVDDEATTDLMTGFYRHLWVEKTHPNAALWQAKMAARAKGVPFRDWAGWVLTGR